MSDVTAIPTELWREITTTACTDGGFTGSSLALTNRFFHAQSLSTRFHSLAFTSLAQLEAFLAFLDIQSTGCRPAIDHLFLSFVRETEPAKPSPNSTLYLPLRSWGEQKKLEWGERFILSMTRLFAVAGPHLRTLCMVEDLSLPFHPFPIGILPKLTELTLNGGCAPFVRGMDVHTSVFKLPSLQRLHYVRTGGPADSALLATLVRHAPASLTHLRFSDLTVWQKDFIVQLAGWLGFGRLDRWIQRLKINVQPPPLAADRLPMLRHVVVHGYAPCLGGVGFDRSTWMSLRGMLKETDVEVCRARGIQVVRISRDWESIGERHWPHRLHADWLVRIEGGGNGCWVHSEKEEAPWAQE